MNIKGKTITLRSIEEEDLEMLRSIMNDPEVEKMLVGWAYPISKFQQKAWFQQSQNESEKRYIIETTEDGAVGLAILSDFDWKNRSAYIGIKIGNEKFRNKGIGTDTIMTIMKYAFDELQLNRLYCTILDYNIASQTLFREKCGWICEGALRKHIYKNGEYHDLKLFGILKDEYNGSNKINYWK